MGLEHRGWAALRATAEGAGLVVGVAAVIAGAGVVGATVAAPVSDQGPLRGVAECAAEYTPEAIAERAFAFDGTVLSVGEADRVGEAGEPVVPVRFVVHTWYHGGDGAMVTVDLPAPLAAGIGGARRGPVYAVGTRLLVSGEVPEGTPLDLPVAWGCGFTRYHDVATAAAWASVD